MDLKHDQITVGELLANPRAKEVLTRRFPAVMRSHMVKMATGLKLSTVLDLAKGRVPARDIQAARQELEQL